MFKNKGYITGFNLISERAAIQLKLNYIQVVILNLFIINWLADKLEKYDEHNPANQLFRFNVYFWAEYFEIPFNHIKRNLLSLTQSITCLDGMQVQLMFRNKRHKMFYVGMELSVIHKLVNIELFNYQCDYHGKPELKCYTQNMELNMPKEPLFEYLLEDKASGKNPYSEWAEKIIKKMCDMACENNPQLFRNGKSINVFAHLKNGEFKKNRKGIDEACKLVDDIYSGQYFRNYKRHEIFGTINAEHLQFKNVEIAVDKLLFLIKDKNKIGIEKYLFRCLRNYFEALKPGRETYQDIKASFPVSVKSFLLHVNRDGTFVANFIMYYFSTLTEKDMKVNQAIIKVKNIVPESVFNKLLDYENYILENQIFSFWLNVRKLTLKIKAIIKEKKTSYSITSCFDIVFSKVDKIAEHYKKVLPGYFDPYEGQTASDAIIELQDK